MQILIVEDVDSMRLLLVEVVSKIPGVKRVTSARNSWEARIEISKNRPDLVLLDEVLPGESGLDLLKELKGLEFKVILLTGIAEPAHPCSSDALGRLIKPGWTSFEKDREKFVLDLAKMAGLVTV